MQNDGGLIFSFFLRFKERKISVLQEQQVYNTWQTNMKQVAIKIAQCLLPQKYL